MVVMSVLLLVVVVVFVYVVVCLNVGYGVLLCIVDFFVIVMVVVGMVEFVLNFVWLVL